ncbi:MAG: cofactor-independent phosphoglycerate mutase [Acidimicrobiia bacterium]
MKYLCIIPDGLADEPLEELNGRTPMEAASTPHIDDWAARAQIGLARNVPDGLKPGSDVAIMSIVGLDPRKHYSGRAPIEAAAMGVPLGEGEVAYRCNFVTVENGVMKDFSAGHISSNEAAALIEDLNRYFDGEARFYAGVSYRNICVLDDSYSEAECTPPHDLTDKEVLLPVGPAASKLIEIMDRSRQILAEHPINEARRAKGQLPATQIWLWGQGKIPSVEPFVNRYGMSGALITAVDLVRGLGVLTGLEVVEVPGATGYYDTNYRGKAEYALESLERHPFCLVHIEATDEAGHEGSYARKIEVYEAIDEQIVATLQSGLEGEEYRVLVVPDHPTPVKAKTHTSSPVPFLIFDTRRANQGGAASATLTFSERGAAQDGRSPIEGHELLGRLFDR